MPRTACAIAVAAAISATACGTSHAAPIAPLPGAVQTNTATLVQAPFLSYDPYSYTYRPYAYGWGYPRPHLYVAPYPFAYYPGGYPYRYYGRWRGSTSRPR